MNRRVCVWIGSVLGCVLCWRATGGETATAASAAPPPGTPVVAPLPVPTLAPTVLASTNATLPATVATIHTFIATQLTGLQSPSGPVVTASRSALTGACPRLPAATASFHAAYTAQLDAAVVALLGSTPPPSLAVKVNLAVVLTQVGTAAPDSIRLDPAVQALLADRSDGVALAAIHAAKPLVIALITQPGGPGKTQLFPAVVNAVKAHSSGDFAGVIAVDAYRTLVVNPSNVAGMPIAAVRPLLKPLYDPVMDLLALRTQLYAAGVVADPEAEAIAPTFLTRDYFPAPPAVTPLMTSAQQRRAVQTLVNLLDAMAQRSGTLTNRTTLGQMRETAQNAGGGLNVMSNTSGLATVVHLPPGVTGTTMAAESAKTFPTMSLTFQWLVKPPVLPVLAPAPSVTPAAAPGAGGASVRP